MQGQGFNPWSGNKDPLSEAEKTDKSNTETDSDIENKLMVTNVGEGIN